MTDFMKQWEARQQEQRNEMRDNIDKFTEQRKDVAVIKAEFSGGHDEGGVDSVSFLDAEGNIIADIDSDADNLATEIMGTYLYTCTDYGSFAGEYYVSGVATLDIEAKVFAYDGEETVEQWQPVGGSYEL